MEDNLQQRNNKRKLLLTLVPVLVLVIAVVGVTYAFFNYTRTGASNTISTGSIYFNSVQTGSIEVTNFFPTDSNSATHGNNSSSMTVTITAGTSYEYGIDYSLTAVNVTRPEGTTTNIPVSVIATTSDAAIGFTPAAEHVITDTENFSLGTGHINQTNSGNSETNGGLEANRVSGVITITAYINAANVAITDTPEESTPWQGSRTVVNTTEWNRLAETPVTFQVRVVADERQPQATTMSLSSNSGSMYVDSSKSVTITTNSTGALSCSSNDTTKATCSISGSTLTINGVAAGSATITVNQGNDASHTPGSITYTANVITPFRGTATQLAASADSYGLETIDEVNNIKMYTGANPDNYVLFNCYDDNDTSTCEQWRILGVYNNQLKIVRAAPLTGLTNDQKKYNLQQSDGNAWEGSNLETYLNGDYYNGLTETAQNMITAGTWNAGATSVDATANTAYSNAKITPVTGKVGLIATYEYLYAAGSSCQTVAGNSYNSGSPTCASGDWLKPSSTVWTLSPSSGGAYYALRVDLGGRVANSSVYTSYGVSPAVYLDSTITITGGNGGIGATNSYKLG